MNYTSVHSLNDLQNTTPYTINKNTLRNIISKVKWSKIINNTICTPHVLDANILLAEILKYDEFRLLILKIKNDLYKNQELSVALKIGMQESMNSANKAINIGIISLHINNELSYSWEKLCVSSCIHHENSCAAINHILSSFTLSDKVLITREDIDEFIYNKALAYNIDESASNQSYEL